MLYRGITGFRDGDDAPLPECDFGAFKSDCFTAARILGGEILSVEPRASRTVRNYAEAIFSLPSGRVSVLLNAHLPVITFAVPSCDADLRRVFVDEPSLSSAFAEFGTYELLSAAEARKPVSAEDFRLLAAAEREQINYWQPECVGDVMFNWWN